jgi:hypothetical protein
MSIAQAHSDYQASIGAVTHTGPGGSSPRDRAAAAGFGGGATVFLSENIAGGMNMSIQTAIYQYWQDDLHLYTMLNPAAVYIGAGVAVSGDTVYYTVDAGYYAGAPSAGSTSIPGGEGTSPVSTSIGYDPFVISTPREDGAIVHIVGYGQSLIGIANTYKVELNDLLQLNDFNMDSIIFPGDEIIIQAGVPLTPTPSPTETPTVMPATGTPTVTATNDEDTPTPRAITSPQPTPSPTTQSTPASFAALTGREQLAIGAAVMAFLVVLAVIASGIIERKRGNSP